ncbi:membrane dipeptidase [Runella defluvii]|uniref:Membrane dipeptidase n=1 Tax=Runella defluvii TaxID=370973 RepID=A0A7W5ZN28_9BACT|nr:membrane dipeptidase [Runella defluvii]MBB3839858.1 membrane dipeptidase [Runella defluvii]
MQTNYLETKPSELDYKTLHEVVITFDAHADVRDDFNSPATNPNLETNDQVDLPKLERGKLDIVNLTVAARTSAPTKANFEEAQKIVYQKLRAIQKWVKANPEKLEFVYNSPDYERLGFSKKHGIILGFQNAFWFNDLNVIDQLYAEGVRIFSFNHVGNNAFSGSSRPVAAYGDTENSGLTPLGYEAVKKLNELGVIIDVSQASRKATLQIVEASKHPVIASNSGVQGKIDNTRNLSDEELKAIANKGGIVHIVAYSSYVASNPKHQEEYIKQVYAPFGLKPSDGNPADKLSKADYAKFQVAYLKFSRNGWQFATLNDYLDSVDYAVQRIGIDHVGISSDFNHGGGVTGYANVGEAENITRELLKRGYSEADIRKLWGRSFFFLFDKIERDSKNSPWGVSK